MAGLNDADPKCLVLYDDGLAERLSRLSEGGLNGFHSLSGSEKRRIWATITSRILGLSASPDEVREFLYEGILGESTNYVVHVKKVPPSASPGENHFLTWDETLKFEKRIFPSAYNRLWSTSEIANGDQESAVFGAIGDIINFWGTCPSKDAYRRDDPPSSPVFNSITDDEKCGDQRIFVFAAKVDPSGRPSGWSKNLNVEPGDEIEVYARYENNADGAGNSKEQNFVSVARDVRMGSLYSRVVTPEFYGGANASITHHNWNMTYTGLVRDGVYFTSKRPARIDYIPGTARIHNDYKSNGAAMSNSLFTKKGTYLGLNELNGMILGGPEFAGHVTYRLKVSEAEGLPEIMPGVGLVPLDAEIQQNPKNSCCIEAKVASTGDVCVDKEYDAILKASVGDVVEFGSYPTSLTSGNKPLSWVILAKESGDAYEAGSILLITEKVIDVVRYHRQIEKINWPDCSLRKWLNSEFVDKAFSPCEKSLLCETRVKDLTPNAEYYSVRDNVFCLSVTEARETYLASDEGRIAQPTDYALQKGVKILNNNSPGMTRSGATWWLRGHHASSYTAPFVNASGECKWDSSNLYGFVNDSTTGVRPVVRIKLPPSAYKHEVANSSVAAIAGDVILAVGQAATQRPTVPQDAVSLSDGFEPPAEGEGAVDFPSEVALSPREKTGSGLFKGLRSAFFRKAFEDGSVAPAASTKPANIHVAYSENEVLYKRLNDWRKANWDCYLLTNGRDPYGAESENHRMSTSLSTQCDDASLLDRIRRSDGFQEFEKFVRTRSDHIFFVTPLSDSGKFITRGYWSTWQPDASYTWENLGDAKGFKFAIGICSLSEPVQALWRDPAIYKAAKGHVRVLRDAALKCGACVERRDVFLEVKTSQRPWTLEEVKAIWDLVGTLLYECSFGEGVDYLTQCKLVPFYKNVVDPELSNPY